MDVKENLAKNLTIFRKNRNLTQLELANKLNYSDKAVSKWERGESVPDLCVLKQLADFYGIKIDDLISEPKHKISTPHLKYKKRLAISLCSTGLVWLVAVLSFSIYNTYLDVIFLCYPNYRANYSNFFCCLEKRLD